jgi:hypothetical protein
LQVSLHPAKAAWMDEKRKQMLGIAKAHPNNLLALLE